MQVVTEQTCLEMPVGGPGLHPQNAAFPVSTSPGAGAVKTTWYRDILKIIQLKELVEIIQYFGPITTAGGGGGGVRHRSSGGGSGGGAGGGGGGGSTGGSATSPTQDMMAETVVPIILYVAVLEVVVPVVKANQGYNSWRSWWHRKIIFY